MLQNFIRISKVCKLKYAYIFIYSRILMQFEPKNLYKCWQKKRIIPFSFKVFFAMKMPAIYKVL